MQKQKIMSTAVSRAESAASDWSFKGFNISQTGKQFEAPYDFLARETDAFVGMPTFFSSVHRWVVSSVKAVWACL